MSEPAGESMVDSLMNKLEPLVCSGVRIDELWLPAVQYRSLEYELRTKCIGTMMLGDGIHLRIGRAVIRILKDKETCSSCGQEVCR